MIDQDKIKQINEAIESYFLINKDLDKVRAKDLMPHFIAADIFEKDHKKGLPIRNLLRVLDVTNKLKLIPSVHFERKKINTNWYFIRGQK